MTPIERRRAAWLLLGLSALGCQPSLHEDVSVFCNPQRDEANAERVLGTSFWLAENLKRKETRSLLREINEKQLTREEAGARLMSLAEEAGIGDCPFAKELASGTAAGREK